MNERIDKIIDSHIDNIIEFRRDLHQHPELAMEEVRTAGKVKVELEKLGLEVKDKVGKTGVVGLLRGKEEGKTSLNLLKGSHLYFIGLVLKL